MLLDLYLRWHGPPSRIWTPLNIKMDMDDLLEQFIPQLLSRPQHNLHRKPGPRSYPSTARSRGPGLPMWHITNSRLNASLGRSRYFQAALLLRLSCPKTAWVTGSEKSPAPDRADVGANSCTFLDAWWLKACLTVRGCYRRSSIL